MTPDKYTINENFIEVGDGYTLYVQEWGDQNGMPIVFLHGGPGSGCKNSHKQTFDPLKHRVFFIDQRGCGRSLPYGSLAHNTTNDLVEDIEKIATKLKIPNFTLVGGSWGSCLALAYGLAHPKRVASMVIGGIFTGSKSEIEYFDKGEYRLNFPDIWENLLDQTPKAHHQNPVTYHHKRALGENKQAAKESAYICENLERSLLSLDDRFTPEEFDEFDPTSILIEIHYLANTCFMPDRFILSQAHKLSMPIWMVQGRYDMVCPGRTAYELHNLLPDNELIWSVSGHKNERESWNVIRNILQLLSKK